MAVNAGNASWHTALVLVASHLTAMNGRYTLLLLVVWSAAVAAQEAQAGPVIQWDFVNEMTFVNHYAPMTGTLMTDEGCEPGSGYCNPISNVKVTVQLAEGVGQLSTDGTTLSPLSKHGAAVAAPPANTVQAADPGTVLSELPSVTVVTAQNGTFAVYCFSNETGISILNATAVVNGTTVSTTPLANVEWYKPNYDIVFEPAENFNKVSCSFSACCL